VYLGLRAWSLPSSARLTTWCTWGIAVGVGFLLAAPQLLLTRELSQYSIRAAGAPGSLAGERSLFPGALVTMVLPSWHAFFDRAGLGGGVYLGLIPCFLAFAALRRGPRRPWFHPLLAATLVATLLACGRYSPLFPIVRRMPGLAYFRVPSRFMMFAQFGLITFFGFGWDLAFEAGTARFNQTLRRIFTACVACASSTLSSRIRSCAGCAPNSSASRSASHNGSSSPTRITCNRSGTTRRRSTISTGR